MKPTPFFVAALVGLLLIILSLWIIATVHNTTMDRRAQAILRSQATQIRPAINCDEGQALWDCIRFVNGDTQ